MMRNGVWSERAQGDVKNIRNVMTYGADEEDDGKNHEGVFPTNGSGHGCGTECAKECAGLKYRDNIGVYLICFILVDFTAWVGDTKVDLEIRLGDDAGTDTAEGRVKRVSEESEKI